MHWRGDAAKAVRIGTFANELKAARAFNAFVKKKKLPLNLLNRKSKGRRRRRYAAKAKTMRQREVGAQPIAAIAKHRPPLQGTRVGLTDLLECGMISKGMRVTFTYMQKRFAGTIDSLGRIVWKRKTYATPRLFVLAAKRSLKPEIKATDSWRILSVEHPRRVGSVSLLELQHKLKRRKLKALSTGADSISESSDDSDELTSSISDCDSDDDEDDDDDDDDDDEDDDSKSNSDAVYVSSDNESDSVDHYGSWTVLDQLQLVRNGLTRGDRVVFHDSATARALQESRELRALAKINVDVARTHGGKHGTVASVRGNGIVSVRPDSGQLEEFGKGHGARVAHDTYDTRNEWKRKRARWAQYYVLAACGREERDRASPSRECANTLRWGRRDDFNRGTVDTYEHTKFAEQTCAEEVKAVWGALVDGESEVESCRWDAVYWPLRQRDRSSASVRRHCSSSEPRSAAQLYERFVFWFEEEEASRVVEILWGELEQEEAEVGGADHNRWEEEVHRQLRRRDGSSASVRRHCSSSQRRLER